MTYSNGHKIERPNLTAREYFTTCTYFGWYYSDRSFEEIALLYCTSGGGGGNSETEVTSGYHGAGGGTNTTTDPNLTTVKIIDSLTDPCAKAIFSELDTEMLKKDILNKFMTTPNAVQLTFAESILKLFNDSNTFNFTILNNNSLSDGENASTTGSKTTISNSYLRNATQLSIARTMIHELLHAYLNVKYSNALSFDNGMDFRLKMEQFAKDNGITDINSNQFHHEFMGQYVDAMAISLLSWDEKYGTGGIYVKDASGNNVLDWQYYKSMAFGGLVYKKTDSDGNYIKDNYGNFIYLDTDSFKSLVPKESDRDNIKKIVTNETEGNSSSKGSDCE